MFEEVEILGGWNIVDKYVEEGVYRMCVGNNE